MIPELPPKVPATSGRFAKAFGRLILRLMGWQIDGQLPNIDKTVLIVAPHTSNWDFVLGMAAKMALGIRAHWLGKDSIFVGPIGRLFKSWGGIPVERSSRHDLVTNVTNEFNNKNAMWLAIAPEGTRKRVEQWKTGFWHIAKTANVPIQTIYLDYSRCRIGIGQLFEPSDDVQADMEKIRAYFKEQGKAKVPEYE